MPSARTLADTELPELERLDAFVGFNTTTANRKRIVLAARLAKKTTAAYLREIIDAETERRLSPPAEPEQRAANG